MMGTYADIGVRLKAERARLGMTQTDFAALAGAVYKTQANYESGLRTPDAAYLAAVAVYGVDVSYVVTGVRSQPLPPDSGLPLPERQLLDAYRNSDQRIQRLILDTSEALSRASSTSPFAQMDV